jgi:L-histidine N-alpha-methyltransferase
MRTKGDAPVTVSHLTEPTDYHAQLLEDVHHGFTSYRKHLPSQYFYDARGSALFEEITQLPEYYLTRAETEILNEHANEIMQRVQPRELIELGSGSSRKTQILIEAMHRIGSGNTYVPIDVSEEALRDAAKALCDDYAWLRIDGLVGDYMTDLDKVPRHGRRLIAFLGSTVGNYVPTLRYTLFRTVAAALEQGDALLLGVDLVKDEAEMVAAYNDSAGISAKFNLNILRIVNRELDADIPLDAFEHVTRFDKQFSCMVQSLRAKREIVANIRALDLAVTFLEGEEIHTEVSCKFTKAQISHDFDAAGLHLDGWLTDSQNRFALALGTKA